MIETINISSISYRFWGTFHYVAFSVLDQLKKKQKAPVFFREKVYMGRGGGGVRVRVSV